MIGKKNHWDGIAYLLFALIVVWGGIHGLHNLMQGVKHVMAAMSTEVVAVKSPDTVPSLAVMAKPQPTGSSDVRKPTDAKAPVHAKDIIKGKQEGTPPDSQEEVRATEPQEGAKPAAGNDASGMTVGTFVERAGLGVGILVKKETRQVLNGFMHWVEQSRIQ
jgi:hypothetical protein